MDDGFVLPEFPSPDGMSWQERLEHYDRLVLQLRALFFPGDEGAAELIAAGKLTWRERIANYHRVTGFPESLFVSGDGRMVGVWILGNDYRVRSAYYGGYPATYLRRVKALFPDKKKVLHLFSGMVDLETFPGDTVDINADLSPTYVDDAQTLTNVPLEQYDLVLADPPYSVEDADHYHTTMINRNRVVSALNRLPYHAHIVWLDQVLPMYSKDTVRMCAVVGIVKSTNHRFRVMTIFQRI